MARLTLDQINQMTPDMASYLQALGYSIGGETDDGMARYMDSNGNWVSPDMSRDLFSNDALSSYAADQRRMQGVIDINDYLRPGMVDKFAEKGYATPEAYLSQLYGGGERVGDYFVLPEAQDVRNAEMVGTPIVYNSPGLFKEFITNAALLAGAGYGLNALTTGGFGGLGGAGTAEAGAGAFGGDIAGTVSAVEGGTAAGAAGAGGAGAAAGGLELGGAAPWWEAGAAIDPLAGALGPVGGATGGGLTGAIPYASTVGTLGTGFGGLSQLAPAIPSLVDGATKASSLSKIWDQINGKGKASFDDWASVLGTAGSSLLGVAGANNQAQGYQDIANQFMNMGAPYREKLLQSYQPGFSMADQPDFQNALDIGAQAAARATSAKYGNPVDNPGAYSEMQKYISGSLALPQLNTYRSQLGSFGQLGTNTAGTAMGNQVQSQGGMYDAIGSGLASLTKPKNPYEDMFKGLLAGYKLNTGSSLA